MRGILCTTVNVLQTPFYTFFAVQYINAENGAIVDKFAFIGANLHFLGVNLHFLDVNLHFLGANLASELKAFEPE